MFDDSWDDAETTREETKSTGFWIRLEDGEKALMVFPAAPYAYKQVWNASENRSEIFDAKKHDGLRPSGRFTFPVFEPVTGKAEYTSKVFTASGTTFDVIKDCREKYGPRYLYEVKRVGKGKDTTYRVMPERELKDAEVEYLKGLELVDAEAATLGTSEPAKESAEAPKAVDPWAK